MTELDKLEELLCSTTKLLISLNPDPATMTEFVKNLCSIINKHNAFKNMMAQSKEYMNYHDFNLDQRKAEETYRAAYENPES